MVKNPSANLVQGLLVCAASLAISFSAGCTARVVHRSSFLDADILKRNWTFQTAHEERDVGDRGVEYSNPIIHQKTLVFGNRSMGLVALYPTINQQRWALPIPGGVISPLAVDQDWVYFGGGDGFLYCVSLETGRVQWRYEIKNPQISRPTLSQGRVLVTSSDDGIYALDAATGKWLWQYRRKSAAAATIRGAAAPLVDGDQVLVGLSDGFLVALTLADGQLRWERKLHAGSKFTDVDAEAVVDRDRVFIPAYDGALYALRRTNGDVLWRFDAGGSRTVTLQAGRLLLPSSDGFVYALDPEGGKLLWKFELDGGVPTQIVATEHYAVVGSSFQYLYVLKADTGDLVSRFNSGWGSGFSGSLAFDSSNNRLYALSMAGNLYAFTLKQPGWLRQRRFGQSHPYRFTSSESF